MVQQLLAWLKYLHDCGPQVVVSMPHLWWPQGSVLRPILLIIYLRSLWKAVSASLSYMCAHGTFTYHPG